MEQKYRNNISRQQLDTSIYVTHTKEEQENSRDHW